MKKLINVLLSAILAISVLAFTACDDGGNVFEADYKETSATELASLVSSVDSATNSDEINFNDGVKLTLDVDVLGSKVKMDMKTQKVNDDLLMEGALTTSTGYSSYTTDIESNVYYKGGYLYSDAKTVVKMSNQVISEQSAKTKQAYALDDYLEVFTDVSMIDLDLDDVVDSFVSTDNVKFYVAKTSSKTNVKIEISNYSEDGNTINGSIIFAFDSNYKLIAYLLDTNIQAEYMGQTVTYKTYMSFEPWSGTITLPSDLSDYN